MSKRPPNELESRLHQAALAAPKKEITAKQAEAVVPDATARQNALNFLLGVGLLKGLTSASGHLSFRAVSKDEIVATKGLTGEENLVLGHIKSSANEGIWTKHLKAKTSLHQTVIDRCLKTLTQKHLIKRVPSVQHITRKIYMLEGLEPSIALTGGPWYTDNELDTEFIQNLTEACYRLISDISFPKRRAGGTEHALYPISNAPAYPTADSVRHALRRAKLTETDLSVEHVEMLLNILVLDGKVEKIPSFGSALWDVDAIPDGADESSDDGRKEKRKKKRKQRARDEESSDDDAAARKKRKKRAASDSESDSDDAAAARRKAKKKRAKDAVDSDDESDSEPAKSKHRKRKKDVSSSEEEDSDAAARRRRKNKKKRRSASSDEDSGSSEEEDSSSRRKKAKARARSKAMKRSSSPAMELDFGAGAGGGSVYRALKAADAVFTWSEAPCELCPSFEFCKEGGPVNARECVYYGEWLSGESLVKEEES